MGFAQEMRDFANGFQSTSSAMEGIQNSRERRADAAARREATRKPNDADLATQPGFGAGHGAVSSRTPGDSSAAAPTNNSVQWSDANPEQKGLLNTIAGTESGGDYGSHYNGDPITDFSDHPRSYATITEGPHKGEKSSAAGRYQFTASTWDSVAHKYNIPDFSPTNQDKAAWYLAADTYKAHTGQDLAQALQSRDPGTLEQVGSSLSSQWAGLKTLPGQKFASTFDQNYKVAATQTPQPGAIPTDTGPENATARSQQKKVGNQSAGTGGSGGGQDPNALTPPTKIRTGEVPSQPSLSAPVIPMDNIPQQPVAQRQGNDTSGLQVASNDSSGWGGTQVQQPAGSAYSGITGAMTQPQLSPEELARQLELQRSGAALHAATGGVIPEPDAVPPAPLTPVQQAANAPRYTPLPSEGPTPDARPAAIPAAPAAPIRSAPNSAGSGTGVIPRSPLPPEDTHPMLGRESPRFNHTYDDSQPPRQLRNDHDVIAKALDSGIHFLQDHFGLKGSGGAVPDPTDQHRAAAGAQRFAQGEGATTPQELQAIDGKIDPQGQLSGSDKQLQRLTQTMQWYQSQGRGKEGAAAAASLMQYGAQRFGQLGSLAGAAYSHYQQSRDPNDLQATMMYLNKAYELIPDGGSFNIAVDPTTHQIIASHTAVDGSTKDYPVTPQELPALVSSAQDKSAYWNQIYTLADPAGARARATEAGRTQRATQRDASRATLADKKLSADAAKYKQTRADKQADIKGNQDFILKRDANKEEAAATKAAAKAAAAGTGKGSASDPNYDVVSPLLGDAQAAAKAATADTTEDPAIIQSRNVAVSKLFDALPAKNRADAIKKMGFEMGTWDYVPSKLRMNDSGSPEDRNAPPAPAVSPSAAKPGIWDSLKAQASSYADAAGLTTPSDATVGAQPGGAPPVNASGSPDDRSSPPAIAAQRAQAAATAYRGDSPPPGVPGARRAKDGAWYVQQNGKWAVVKPTVANSSGGPDTRSSPESAGDWATRQAQNNLDPVNSAALAPTPVDNSVSAAPNRADAYRAGRAAAKAPPAGPAVRPDATETLPPARKSRPAMNGPYGSASGVGTIPGITQTQKVAASQLGYKGTKEPKLAQRGMNRRDPDTGVWYHQNPTTGKWDYVRAGQENGL